MLYLSVATTCTPRLGVPTSRLALAGRRSWRSILPTRRGEYAGFQLARVCFLRQLPRRPNLRLIAHGYQLLTATT